jgi:glycosyltransferase involved in cell wall biosynthesis
MPKDKPLISVIMPVHNGEKFLNRAVESILSQTYREFEFIIINDGSTDRTDSIIRSYSDKRIVYLKKEANAGVVDCLNLGLRTAKGSFIARMDADDISLPQRFQSQIDVLTASSDVLVVGTDYFIVGGERTQGYKRIFSTLKRKIDSDYLKTVLLFSPCFCHPSVMMKNVFGELNVLYDRTAVHTEDYKLWTDLSFHGKFHFINAPLLKYRVHTSQVSALNKPGQLATSAKIRQEYLERLGIRASEKQFAIHNLAGDNTFIRSIDLLQEIEAWFKELIRQNSVSGKLNPVSFNIAIHKYWGDLCGNTNLGLKAFRYFVKSDLAKVVPVSAGGYSKLLLKCLVRKFRK